MGQNVLAVYLVVKQVEALFRFVLRLTIQLDLKFSDTTWCCQTHRQSPSFPLSQAHQQARALCSASITRPQRSYDPLRRPRPTAVLSDDVRRRDLRQSWTSPNYPDHLSCMLCSLPRWIGSGALIGCPLPCTVRPSPLCRRVGIHNLLSRPAQASRGYGLQDCSSTIRGLYHEAPSYAGFPVSNARQLPSPTDNYLGGSFPHWCSTPLGRTA